MITRNDQFDLELSRTNPYHVAMPGIDMHIYILKVSTTDLSLYEPQYIRPCEYECAETAHAPMRRGPMNIDFKYFNPWQLKVRLVLII